jgi:hypothetical protein
LKNQPEVQHSLESIGNGPNRTEDTIFFSKLSRHYKKILKLKYWRGTQMFKEGDLVMITYHLMNGEMGIAIMSKDFGMGIRWCVHLTNGRDLWFPEYEMKKVV